jgi:hypothetical protein
MYPFEWSTMDGYFVYHGMRLVAGQPIYFGYESILMPFEYVPLYPAVIGSLAAVFGPGVWYERLFGLACALTIALLIDIIVARRTSDRVAAAIGGLFFLAPSVLAVWYLVRGLDIFALLLALAGVYAVERAEEHGMNWALLGTFFFVAAFFTKQTALFPALAALLYAACRDRKKSMIMALSFGGAVLSIVFLLQFLTHGWFFENAFVTTSKNPFLVRILLDLLKSYSLWLFIAFPVAFYHAARNIGRRPDIWALYFFATLLSVGLAGKLGAALSYFIPLLSATCISLGLFLGDDLMKTKRPRIASAVAVLLVVQTLVLFHSFIRVPSPMDRQQAEILDRHLKNNPGPILTERIDSFATLNGRGLNVEAVQLPILIKRGKFDVTTLMRPIRNKEFSLIVYSGIYFGGTYPLKQAIFDNYEIVDRVNLGLFHETRTFLVLVPAEST